jgi:hypothetical protein
MTAVERPTGALRPRGDAASSDALTASRATTQRTTTTTGTAKAAARKERPMKTSTPNLIRLAGLSAVIAGVCYILVGALHPANVAASVTGTRWAVVHVLACATSFFGVLGIAGIHARQATKTGWLGLIGMALLSLWLVIIMGFSFVEAFILPHPGTVSPEFIEGWMGMFNGDPSKVDLGALPTIWTLTAPMYIGGAVLFGLATYRARIFPRAAAVLLALGTAAAPVAALLLPLASQPKVAIPTGLAIAWLGYALFTERAQQPASPVPEPATMSA